MIDTGKAPPVQQIYSGVVKGITEVWDCEAMRISTTCCSNGEERGRSLVVATAEHLSCNRCTNARQPETGERSHQLGQLPDAERRAII